MRDEFFPDSESETRARIADLERTWKDACDNPHMPSALHKMDMAHGEWVNYLLEGNLLT